MNSERQPKSMTLSLIKHWFPVQESTRLKRMDKGYASSNWIFSYGGSRYMLKRFMGYKKKADIEKEYKLTNYVRGSGFPYKVPEMLAAKGGKPYVESGGALYSMYLFIPGEADMPIKRADSYEVGTLAAKLHNIFEKPRFMAAHREGYQTLESIKERLKSSYKSALRGKGVEDKAFASAYRFFMPLLESLDLS